MKDQLAFQKLLHSKYQEMKKRNAQVSIRMFSKKIGIHFGTLSSILNGKRNVSRALAEKIALKLSLDPQERSELLSNFPESPQKKKTLFESGFDKTQNVIENDILEKRYLKFNDEQSKMIYEWEHIAIMSLLNCSDFKSDAEWISHRLGITLTRSKEVINRLLELSILTISKEGNYSRTKQPYRSTDDLSSDSIKRSHEESLELAKKSLKEDKIEHRDLTSITMAIDPKKMNLAKEMIRKFEDELSDALEVEDRSEVYRLSIQFFPLTKRN